MVLLLLLRVFWMYCGRYVTSYVMRKNNTAAKFDSIAISGGLLQKDY